MRTSIAALLLTGCAPAIHINAAKPVSPLVVEAVRPSAGDAGEVVVLTGTGFTKDVQVSFGGAPADIVRVVDGDRVEVVVPPGKGVVDVCISSEEGSWIALAGWSYGGESDGVIAFCFDVPSTTVTVARSPFGLPRRNSAPDGVSSAGR